MGASAEGYFAPGPRAVSLTSSAEMFVRLVDSVIGPVISEK